MTSTTGREVLLLGSVALLNTEEVFRAAGSVLGARVRRIPDGETGIARSLWIQCQTPFFLGHPQLESVEADPAAPGGYKRAQVPSGGIYSPTMRGAYQGRVRLRPGVAPEDLRFDNLGYADWAVESYETFKRLKQEGAIAESTRLQVSLPSLRVIVGSRVLPPEIPKIAPAYAAGMAREVERMATLMPREELAVQWDCTEPVQYEQAGETDKRAITNQLAGYAAWVPEGVELGYHLCYGDWEHKHFAEPRDTGAMVEMANAITAAVSRPIDWLHLPVPRERDDDTYFAPLTGLKLHPETKLFLGLVHYTDGLEGTRKRMQAASKVVQDYGIATECGMGRRPSETIMDLLRIHQQAAEL
ncbi:MAG TPA: hypothetical protein VJB57_09905 [Dehalococcoidia bacterium]|nr:hypothetical protein [Dehalococcoidia bacterium]